MKEPFNQLTGVLTTSGTTSIWPSNTISPIISSTIPTVDSSNWYTLNTTGSNSVNVVGDLNINGDSLLNRLDKIEERLGILTANHKLEAKWEKLKKLGNKYRALEADIIEKEKIWAILEK